MTDTKEILDQTKEILEETKELLQEILKDENENDTTASDKG